MFRDARGALYAFLKEIGRDMSDCGKGTPLQEFIGRLGETSLPNWLLAHMNELTKNDFDLLKKSARQSSVVYCPRSHAYFGHSPFEFQKLHELGFNICLGTDSLVSNQDLSLFAEARAFQKKFPNVSADEIFKMVTTNPARALRQENVFGKMRAGFVADLIAVPVERSTSVFEEIVSFDGSVRWSMIDGRISA